MYIKMGKDTWLAKNNAKERTYYKWVSFCKNFKYVSTFLWDQNQPICNAFSKYRNYMTAWFESYGTFDESSNNELALTTYFT